jgi:hypothetical protein
MKELNLPEAQLRSWQPRRPSDAVRQRIFVDPPVSPSAAAWWLRCLVPATACLLVAMTTWNHSGRMAGESASPGFMLGMVGSNGIAYLPGDYQQPQNRLSSVTFGWTNPAGSTSSIGSFSPDKVN